MYIHIYIHTTIHAFPKFTPTSTLIQRNKCYEGHLSLYNFAVKPSFPHGQVSPSSVSISIHDDTGNFWSLQDIVMYHLII